MKNTLEVLMSRLRMKQLQLLIALDDHKSLHKASSAMAMTQSAASKALAELESMLEAPLFERAKSGLIPNPFGRCVVRYARVLAADLNALCQEVAQIRAGTGGRLTVGTIMGAVPGVVAPIVNEMHARHPDLAIEVVEDTSARMLPMLDDGRLLATVEQFGARQAVFGVDVAVKALLEKRRQRDLSPYMETPVQLVTKGQAKGFRFGAS